jgi:hypothetical protein
MPVKMQIFTLFFLMSEPLKIIGPLSKISHGSDPKLVRQIAAGPMISIINSRHFLKCDKK